jgi:hypothetical protein
MKKKVKFKFVKVIPDSLDEGTVYITIHYNTAIHKCVCGCGNEVGTPLSSNDWELSYNGESISLYPSIGNWSFECQSHYWIRNSKVVWAEKWSKNQIEENRKKDIVKKEEDFKRAPSRQTFWSKIFKH